MCNPCKGAATPVPEVRAKALPTTLRAAHWIWLLSSRYIRRALAAGTASFMSFLCAKLETLPVHKGSARAMAAWRHIHVVCKRLETKPWFHCAAVALKAKAAVKMDSTRRQNKTAASSIFLVDLRTPIRHYFPMCRAAAWTDLSVCIGISPLPGSPRAAPIACGVFHARTVAEQKYHDPRYGSWRAPGARRTANVSMLPDMRLSRFSRECPPISSDKKRTNSAVLLAQKVLQFSYAGVNRPPYRTFANAFRFCYL